MKRAALALVVALALAGAARADPTVVELYQSQGCSSCPPADANVNAIAGAPNLLVLSFGVTYWDQLGWKDTFASPRFTARQWAYAHDMRRDYVATPQVVINGRRDVEGADPRALYAAIRAAGSPSGASLGLTGDRAVIAAGPAPRGGADVWLVRYDPRVLNVAIRAGENGGKTLPHRNVVRELMRLGVWTGAASGYPLPRAADPNWKTAILVQAPDGGPILAAAKL
jgi:hypothetical protein